MRKLFGIVEPSEEAIEFGAVDRNLRIPDGLKVITLWETDGKKTYFVGEIDYSEFKVGELEQNGIPVFELTPRELAERVAKVPREKVALGSWELGELELERE